MKITEGQITFIFVGILAFLLYRASQKTIVNAGMDSIVAGTRG